MEKKISIALIIGLIVFPQISETIYTPALPAIARGLNTSASLVEATLAVYFLGFALGVALWGGISDYIGRRRVMLLGLFFYGAATWSCALAKSIESLLFWRFFQAFGASVGSVITQTILRDIYTANERTKMFSIISGALAFSPALGPLIGGFLSELFGWRANFWLLIVVALVLLIVCLASLKETRSKKLVPASKKEIYSLFLTMLSNRSLWGHVLLIGGTNGILFGFYQEAPFIFIEQLKVSSELYGCFGFLIAGATLSAARFTYTKSHRFSSDYFIQRGAVCIFSGGLLLTSLALLDLFSTTTMSLSVIVALLFLIFFGIGLIIPNSLSHALTAYQNRAGIAGSIFGGTYYCLIAFDMWIMSIIHNGTILPLPLYILSLSLTIFLGATLVKKQSLLLPISE